MDSSAANTTNLQSTTYVQNPNISEGAQPVSQPTVTNVDMTNVENNTTQQTTQIEEAAKTKIYDSDNSTVPTSYIKNYMSGLNKPDMFKTNENGDSYNYTNVLSNSNGIKDAFTGQFRRDAKFQNLHQEATKLFASQDQTNYRYMHHPILGNMRVAIDANGKDIGLPEAINETGNPFIFEDPKNIHTMLV